MSQYENISYRIDGDEPVYVPPVCLVCVGEGEPHLLEEQTEQHNRRYYADG